MSSLFERPRPRWETVAQEAFWDRHVQEADWREGFLAGAAAYVPQTLKTIEPWVAIGLMGKDAFVQHWPDIRAGALLRWPTLARRICKWDVYWSLAATGTPDVRPLADWPKLARRTREFLLHIATHQGSNIYAAGKALGMTYRRAHDHAMKLVGLGFLVRRDTHDDGRRKTLLYAAQSVEHRQA